MSRFVFQKMIDGNYVVHRDGEQLGVVGRDPPHWFARCQIRQPGKYFAFYQNCIRSRGQAAQKLLEFREGFT